MISWIRGWWATYQFWRHDRDTYRLLAAYRYDDDDFGDVQRPI